MKAKKAIKKSFNANVRILTENAIDTIKASCKVGNYIAEVDLIENNELENEAVHKPAFKINDHVIKNLQKLGYRIGSQNHAKGKYFVNVFWSEPQLKKEDFIKN